MKIHSSIICLIFVINSYSTIFKIIHQAQKQETSWFQIMNDWKGFKLKQRQSGIAIDEPLKYGFVTS